MSEADFKKAAEAAKAGCPVSKLFKGAEITLDASLA
jgi:osmotically inducible protein OsmC